MIGICESMDSTTTMMHMDQHMQMKAQSPSSSRILDIPCKVCGDFSSGKHYNIFACDGCAGFFKRSIRKSRKYTCKAKAEGTCIIDKTHRNHCRACRLQKCQEVGMNKDAVQHERGPRNSTLRRQQMSNYMNEANTRLIIPQSHPEVLNLTLTKPESISPGAVDPFFALRPASALFYNNMVAVPNFSPTIAHQLTPPSLLPSMFSCSAICESAARLLFMNVQWTRSISSFTSLQLSDQLLLLQESWRELFILGAAQFLPITDMSLLVHSSGYLARDPANANAFLQEVKEFQDLLTKLNQMQLDQHEYGCLRAIALFKTNFDKSNEIKGEPKELTDLRRVGLIQDETQLALNKYIGTAYPGQPLRFGKLLLFLPSMRSISGNTIEELFFRKTIGNIPIVRIICDMYKSQETSI